LGIITPRSLGLKHDSWRPGQWETIQQIEQAQEPVIIIEAPTGSGKSEIALGTARHSLDRTMTLTHTKSLQDQYMSEGGDLIVKMMGRANYPCVNRIGDAEERELAELLGEIECGCTSRDDCPYQQAKKRAMERPLVSLNYAYWLPEASYVGGFKGADYLFADEGHLLDNVLVDFASLSISKRMSAMIEKLGVNMPRDLDNIQRWIEYGVKAREKAADAVSETSGHAQEVWKKRVKFLTKIAQLDPGHERWIVEEDGGGMSIGPVWAPSIQQTILTKTKKLVIMSATILDHKFFAQLMGLDGNEYRFIKLPWTFPVDSRPIYYRPVAEVTRETQADAAPSLAAACDYVLEKRTTDKGVIHTRSFTLGNLVYPHIKNKDRILFHTRGVDRGEIIKRFKEDRTNLWLMSPSVSHGEDFAHDIARVQILLKMPLPDRSNRRVRIRSKQRPYWYYYAAAQDLIQTLGRVTRDSQDYGECVVVGTKVLTADLRWLSVEELVVGDKVLSFDDHTGGRGTARRWRVGTVEQAAKIVRPCYTTILEDGTELTASTSHKWLTRGYNNVTGWRRADELLGQGRGNIRVFKYLNVWEEGLDYKHGWLGGFFDGEGTISLDQGLRNPKVMVISAAQRVSPTADRALNYLSDTRFTYTTRLLVHGGLGKHKLLSMRITGGFREGLRFLGQCRPGRLIDKLVSSGYGNRMSAYKALRVKDIVDAGDREVVSLKVDVGTYVAEGFGSHNSWIFDGKMEMFLGRYRQLMPKEILEAMV